MATNNSVNYVPTQYNVITGGASGLINNVAPSATSGVALISQGASSQPIFGTIAIAGGGTNATSFGTTHGTVVYDGTRLVNYAGPQISTGGVATNTSQPAFLAYVTSTLTNKTGDGTVYSLTAAATWTILQQNGTNFTTAGTFTAPVSGFYLFTGHIQLTGTTVSVTETSIRLVVAGTSAFTYEVDPQYVPATGSNYIDVFLSVVAYMTATDTLTMQVQASGITKIVSVAGGTNNSWISGALLC